ncbi:hypothetical protein QKW35_08515 [Pontibacterium granulatum]|uniref:hypothetical protein n=1 Tax=Pontibacterium granulatum TaxID=2036029 RepID=UPI00249A5B09|nr:hypothetical protein [Pontibacterium granulatum]MDI3324416.1 hypothetical protein [Pontibacterium granulatum]
MALLFALAQWVERRNQLTGKQISSPWVYALSIAVYHTSWTFYGSVGFAATSGLLFLGVYLGGFIAVMFWHITLRKMIQAKETYRITSIADFISTRYNRSQKIAALVTIIALLGIVPYISLQLKAVVASFNLITHDSTQMLDSGLSGFFVTLMMIAFTILFGVRRLDPTERHQGMIFALVAECIVKLVAFISVGLFVSFVMFDGFADINQRLAEAGLEHVTSLATNDNAWSMWVTLIVLSFFAVQLLPRQFHVAVVENTNQKHIRTSMWLFPLYMILINIFVVPIAAGGLLSGLDSNLADFYVLLLPKLAGNNILSLVAFIGGFSAATGMIIITTMTLATMASNHLVLPAIERTNACAFLRGYLLQVRWGLVTLILVGSYWFTLEFADSYILVSIGLMSFVAILQFGPATFGGLFWKKANSMGAFLGLFAGFLAWAYTLVLPTLAKNGWFAMSLLNQGPFGIEMLRPEALFGLEGLNPVTHAVLWSMLANVGTYVAFSLLYQPNKTERNFTAEFMCAMLPRASGHKARPTGLEAYIALPPKLEEAHTLLSNYLPADKAREQVNTIADDLQVLEKTHITIIELVEFHRMLEHVLAGSIGSAGAHGAIENRIRYSDKEAADLQAVFSHIVNELQGPGVTSDLGKSDTQDTGMGLLEDLQAQIDKLQLSIQQKDNEITTLERKLDDRYEEIFKYRLEVQKTHQENEALRRELGEKLSHL